MARTLAVALVDSRSAPIYVKRFQPEDTSLDLLFVVHSALDGFEDGTARRGARKSYLGLLNLIDGCAVFGYLSNTQVRTVVVMEAGTGPAEDTAMEAYLKALYMVYVNTMSNPFVDIGASLQEPGPDCDNVRQAQRYPELLHGFRDRVDAVVKQFDAAAAAAAAAAK